MSVPVPPVRRAAVRYSAQMAARARELHDAGALSLVEIRSQLIREFGAAPTSTALHMWVDDAFAEQARARHRRKQARYRRRDGVAQIIQPGTLTDADLLALRVEDGLSHQAIVNVARRFYATSLTVWQVRERLAELGAPKNPNKARPPRVSA
jgi:hypothetical protein